MLFQLCQREDVLDDRKEVNALLVVEEQEHSQVRQQVIVDVSASMSRGVKSPRQLLEHFLAGVHLKSERTHYPCHLQVQEEVLGRVARRRV